MNKGSKPNVKAKRDPHSSDFDTGTCGQMWWVVQEPGGKELSKCRLCCYWGIVSCYGSLRLRSGVEITVSHPGCSLPSRMKCQYGLQARYGWARLGQMILYCMPMRNTGTLFWSLSKGHLYISTPYVPFISTCHHILVWFSVGACLILAWGQNGVPA